MGNSFHFVILLFCFLPAGDTRPSNSSLSEIHNDVVTKPSQAKPVPVNHTEPQDFLIKHILRNLTLPQQPSTSPKPLALNSSTGSNPESDKNNISDSSVPFLNPLENQDPQGRLIEPPQLIPRPSKSEPKDAYTLLSEAIAKGEKPLPDPYTLLPHPPFHAEKSLWLEWYSKLGELKALIEYSNIHSDPVFPGPEQNETEFFQTRTMNYVHVSKKDVEEEACPRRKRCKADKIYYPSCGSDGKTYFNYGVLACAQRCNIDLELVSFKPCPDAVTIPTTTQAPITKMTFPPQVEMPKELRVKILTRMKEFGSPYDIYGVPGYNSTYKGGISENIGSPSVKWWEVFCKYLWDQCKWERWDPERPWLILNQELEGKRYKLLPKTELIWPFTTTTTTRIPNLRGNTNFRRWDYKQIFNGR